jgi:GSH-dependent disulfide-bond oxidoreductase
METWCVEEGIRGMITLYTGPTPNGRKIGIFLEEAGLAYQAAYVDILEGDQFAPSFLALNPNNKFPVIVDSDGPGGGEFVLWESGAILWYLAEKTGQFLPQDPRERAICHQWLMFQMAGVGPMMGQMAHFFFYAKKKHPYALDRYMKETRRLLRVIDQRLKTSRFIAGDTYTIADMALYPWIEGTVNTLALDKLSIRRWAGELKARPAVQRGMDVVRDKVRPEIVEGGMKGFNDAHRSALFGDRQHEER